MAFERSMSAALPFKYACDDQSCGPSVWAISCNHPIQELRNSPLFVLEVPNVMLG